MEQPEWMAMSGKTVEEAIEVALKGLDADRAEAEIEILSPGKPGFLGIRSEPARVRVRRIPAARGAAGLAMEIVNKILAATGTQTITTLKSAHDQDAGGPSIDITGSAAVARVELYRDFKHIFTDYLSLYRFDDGWKIVGKIFYQHQ